METESVSRPTSRADEERIGLLGTFASPALESMFRQRHFRDDLWISSLIIPAAMVRVALMLWADHEHFGVGSEFWPLFACRALFLLVSLGVLLALRRVTSAAAADRLFLGWASLLAGLTVYAIAARLPHNNELLLMSFVAVLTAYLVTPLPLSRQMLLALAYTAAVFFVFQGAGGASVSTVVVAYVLSNLFGAFTSWRLNRRRREAFVGMLRETELRMRLEKAAAEIKTLRGMLCICAWCKRVRDEVEEWDTVENFVKNRTDAAFTHGICPDCLQSQVVEIAGSGVNLR